MTSARWLPFAAVLCLAGCFGTSNNSDADPATWVEENIAMDDVSISLGHLENEPVARVTRGGNAAADVMVFCGIAESKACDLLSYEVATIYDRESKLYVAEGFDVAAQESGTQVRFRVVLPNTEQPWIGHMPLP